MQACATFSSAAPQHEIGCGAWRKASVIRARIFDLDTLLAIAIELHEASELLANAIELQAFGRTRLHCNPLFALDILLMQR